MTTAEVRHTYLEFFKAREHSEIPSAPLVPENDPTTLFTSSGMQPLLPYLLGEKHPSGVRLVDSQKSFRAEDIEEVGDNRHTTFFEMLGNWSLGDYFKSEQLPWFFEFLTKEIGLDPQKLYVTVFSGDEKLGITKDEESIEIWKRIFKEEGIDAIAVDIGTEADGYARGMREGERIFAYEAKKNWWSRSGTPEKMPAGEPGGPDSEVFYDFGTAHDTAFGEHCHPNCDCGRFMEIGNSVFMEYIKKSDGSFEKLPQQNVDFGGGLERIVAAANDVSDVFCIDSLYGIITEIESLSGKVYGENEEESAAFRIVADHFRGAVFMIGDGVVPSNTEQGYFVRRLLRRAVLKMDTLEMEPHTLHTLVPIVIQQYEAQYPNLRAQKDVIQKNIEEEEARFRKTVERGLKEFEKRSGENISGRDAFVLFTTHGFPIELTLELAAERGITVDMEGFRSEMEKHQALSRAGAEQKFKGGLADGGEKTTMYHSATHLLLAGLRKYLGEDVHQAGSNITTERTRFDFTYPEKVDRETLDKVEQYVNDAIKAQAEMTIEEMPKEQAKAEGVEGSFWEKYPEVVKVYTLRDANGVVWSRELCGGPHVSNTNEITGVFKIVKEESSSAGVRRVKAVLE
ncbi:alanine--tRNA ligase [Candidatus Kaiserbacteria bacterium CG10_big_fil_rev_8_21_14_0_10_49_17]|uniref:alanine--tRNA ligase n=1 Tax=Candidatus Kaiserbacteria bacterium CG10_big_fil_rev_8_21_14_0_10_49_17 TaxID=1974609 RepID=A0A2M6WF97_9BACT|nr:MAG: alanine--tRNA ligase [Candidatus Kaiserbacteria bacterium CG10_big_fil_rev_8_21_14_0_10_49_17]